MQKKFSFFIDNYTVEICGNLSEQGEQLLIPSIMLAVVYERQMKELYH